MPMPSKETADKAERGALQYAFEWGENSLPPTLLATLITAQHLRPFQTLPMLFPPVLLFSSYLNVSGYQKDAAGLTAAWSAAYFVLAGRRRQQFTSRFGARGLVRGATLALCAANVIGGGIVYGFSKKEEVREGK